MNLINITYPEGALDENQRRTIAIEVLENLLIQPDAPPEAVERAGHLTHVWFSEARSWTTVTSADQGSAQAPFVVTVTVPEAFREDLSGHAIGVVRKALAGHVAPGRPGTVWVSVVGVHDGSMGMDGRPSTSSDIVRYLTQDIAPTTPVDLSDGEVIDPVCGMRVQLGPQACTLVHDGRTIGFCAAGCRTVYAQDHGIPVNA